MRNGLIVANVIAAGFIGFWGGYGYAQKAGQERRDSLRVALTQLEERYRVAMVTDSIRADEQVRQAQVADSLTLALRRAHGRIRVQIDTLRTFELPPGALAVLDSLVLAVGTAEAVAESLTVAHRAQVVLFEQRLSSRDSLIAEYRLLAQAAVKAPPPRRGNGLKLLAVGVVIGAGLWEIAR